MDHRFPLQPLHFLNRRLGLLLTLALACVGTTGCLHAMASPFDITAGGPLWLALTGNVTPRFLAITNTLTAFAYSGTGNVTALPYSTPSSAITSLGRLNDGQLLAVTGVPPSDTYYVSTDEGKTWTAKTAATGTGLAHQAVATCGQRAMLFHANTGAALRHTFTTDGGVGWTAPVDSCVGGGAMAVQSAACVGTRFFLAGTCAGVATIRFGDEGVTSPWSSSAIGSSNVLNFVGTTTSIVTADNPSGAGVVHRSTDNGANFSPVDNILLYNGALLYAGSKFLSASFSAPDCLFRTSTDGASGSWAQSTAPCSLTGPRLNTAASSGSTIVVGGTHNANTTPFLVRSTDGGVTWQMDPVSASGVTSIVKIIAL